MKLGCACPSGRRTDNIDQRKFQFQLDQLLSSSNDSATIPPRFCARVDGASDCEFSPPSPILPRGTSILMVEQKTVQVAQEE